MRGFYGFKSRLYEICTGLAADDVSGGDQHRMPNNEPGKISIGSKRQFENLLDDRTSAFDSNGGVSIV